MHTLTITRVGNSSGVVLPKEVLNTLSVEHGDKLFLTRTPEGGFRITPYDPEFEKKMIVARKVMNKRRNALRELAK